MEMLQIESELLEIVQLVGSDALPESQQITLESARMIREIFLQQNSFHPVDTYCSFDHQYKLLKSIMRWSDLASKHLEEGATVKALINMESKAELAKVKYEEKFDELLTRVMDKMESEFSSIGGGY
jgi:V/A-type H+-transporting ATPase subunit A